MDRHHAAHLLQQVKWESGQTLKQHATRIQDLYFRAHPDTPAHLRDEHTGHYFMLSMPSEWQKEIRRQVKGVSLNKYLKQARYLQNDQELDEKLKQCQQSQGLKGDSGEQGQVESQADFQGYPADQNQDRSQGQEGFRKQHQQKKRSDIECFYCEEFGHFRSECELWKEELKRINQKEVAVEKPGGAVLKAGRIGLIYSKIQRVGGSSDAELASQLSPSLQQLKECAERSGPSVDSENSSPTIGYARLVQCSSVPKPKSQISSDFHQVSKFSAQKESVPVQQTSAIDHDGKTVDQEGLLKSRFNALPWNFPVEDKSCSLEEGKVEDCICGEVFLTGVGSVSPGDPIGPDPTDPDDDSSCEFGTVELMEDVGSTTDSGGGVQSQLGDCSTHALPIQYQNVAGTVDPSEVQCSRDSLVGAVKSGEYSSQISPSGDTSISVRHSREALGDSRTFDAVESSSPIPDREVGTECAKLATLADGDRMMMDMENVRIPSRILAAKVFKNAESLCRTGSGSVYWMDSSISDILPAFHHHHLGIQWSSETGSQSEVIRYGSCPLSGGCSTLSMIWVRRKGPAVLIGLTDHAHRKRSTAEPEVVDMGQNLIPVD